MVFFLSLCAVQASSFAWNPVQIDSQEYISAREIADFYRFSRLSLLDADRAAFRSPTLSMQWEAQSPVLVINDTKFLVSAPCRKQDGQFYISRADLVKWIDPLLRPAHMAGAEAFDTVVIDAGHGGLDVGTRGPFDVEKNYALDLALRLRDELRQRGLRTVMTRQADVRLSKHLRGELASAVPGSIFVSLHFNANPSRSVHGIETYAMTPVGQRSSNDSQPGLEARLGFHGNLRENASLALAAAVHSQLLSRTGAVDRAVRRARFAVLKTSQRASILVEGGYLTNRAEAARIHQPDYRATLARAIADGILHYRRSLREK